MEEEREERMEARVAELLGTGTGTAMGGCVDRVGEVNPTGAVGGYCKAGGAVETGMVGWCTADNTEFPERECWCRGIAVRLSGQGAKTEETGVGAVAGADDTGAKSGAAAAADWGSRWEGK